MASFCDGYDLQVAKLVRIAVCHYMTREVAAQILIDALIQGKDMDGVQKVLIQRKIPATLLRMPSTTLRNACHFRRRAVPNVENSALRQCSLSHESTGRRLRCRNSQQFVADLFKTVESESWATLNRFDLFHGHVFTTREGDSGDNSQRVGILFHAKEYPAYDEHEFSVNLGRCQVGSSLKFQEEEFQSRNILWLTLDKATSLLALLDTSVLKDLLVVPELHTTYEGDFGKVEGDIYYFDSLHNRKISERLFVVPR